MPGFLYGFGIMFVLMFVLVFGMIFFVLIRAVSQWNKNNHSPKLTVDATVVSKRERYSSHHHGDIGSMYSTTHTYYYVTFQVESGDRMELCVDGSEYGLLVEGDVGKLSFQGTRYLGFERGF